MMVRPRFLKRVERDLQRLDAEPTRAAFAAEPLDRSTGLQGRLKVRVGDLGLSQHDIRHAIGQAVASQLWYMNKEGCVFDEGRYMADLRKTVELRRQDRDGN